ncbi:MAG TPA: ABC transporter permease [Hyphomicrobiaceae bacterium]|nr:ABC transporter permease [Hyphomicrobiaceae bacterium]
MAESRQDSELLARAGANVNGPLGQLLFFVRRYPLGAAGGLIVAAIIFIALFAGVLAKHDPTAIVAKLPLLPPGGEYSLGTDDKARDVWARIAHGARISLMVGIGATLLGCLIGTVIGLISGYFGGWLDLLVQRVMDIMQALPLLVMALLMAVSIGPKMTEILLAMKVPAIVAGIMPTIIAIAIPTVPNVARIIRSNTLALREMPYVEAARAVGMNEVVIAFRHVLPNTLAPLIVLATAQLGSAILVEASLSFLGLGIPEPHSSWGRMLSESSADYMRQAPWLVIFPGIAISLTVFGMNLLGDALRDLLDPRQRS